MKTNKSFSSRLRVTRTGKVMARIPGQNHFNAKESRRGRMARARTTTFTMSNKSASRFLVGL